MGKSPDWTDADFSAMHRALVEAARGQGRVEPNPMVGAVVVSAGEVLSVGHHEGFGGPHAEVIALAQAGPAARGATLYVSLEPCCHHGKTPPCTEAIRAAGIARVVVATRDPFPAVAGGGIATLRASGICVDVGLMANEALRLNAPYFKRVTTGRPYVIAKWAMTLDGKIATATHASRWITGARCRALAHALRGRVDAIVVGIGTVLADDPQLTARPAGPRAAVRVILDAQARLPVTSRLATTARAIPVLVACTEPGERATDLARAGCELAAFPGHRRVPIVPLLELLGQRGATNVLVEGGAEVLGSFFDAGEVDEVDVYVAPAIVGGRTAPSGVGGDGVAAMADALRLEVVDVAQIDGDLRIRGTIARTWRDAVARDALA